MSWLEGRTVTFDGDGKGKGYDNLTVGIILALGSVAVSGATVGAQALYKKWKQKQKDKENNKVN